VVTGGWVVAEHLGFDLFSSDIMSCSVVPLRFQPRGDVFRRGGPLGFRHFGQQHLRQLGVLLAIGVGGPSSAEATSMSSAIVGVWPSWAICLTN
jgi:hypothetical protein